MHRGSLGVALMMGGLTVGVEPAAEEVYVCQEVLVALLEVGQCCVLHLRG
jgi:hypothetical protein